MSNTPIPRPEYPRPDFARKSWLCLNGRWEFAFDDGDVGIEEGWYAAGPLEGEITVPFCYQSPASGLGLADKHEILWYAREIEIPRDYLSKRLLLHFGAVDYEAQVWVDGCYVGEHTGGYTPFHFDITHLLRGEQQHRVTLRVRDLYRCTQPRGKQNWEDEPFGCWYTPVSGIWQSVWLEPLEELYLTRAHITPDIDSRRAYFECYLNRIPGDGRLEIEVAYQQGGHTITCSKTLTGNQLIKATVDLSEECFVDEIHYWTPETPHLYDAVLRVWQGERCVDEVQAYFGMRKIDIQNGEIRLNNRPFHQRLLLDQGYWEESLLTPPSDDAIQLDLRLAKEMGFNGVRKHQKIEDPRFYYWADRMGMLVWGEVPSGYEFCTEEAVNLTHTLIDFIQRDYNHPSIILWVPLNESWGVRNICTDPAQQRCADSLYALAKMLDPTRLVSGNDGWEQTRSDICAIHDYVAWSKEIPAAYQDIHTMRTANGGRMLYADGYGYGGEPVLITEYGGIAFAGDSGGGNWGYNGAVETEEDFLRRFADITAGFRALPYVQGFCYTQLTDVFQEVNGLLSMDRTPKVPVEKIRAIVG